MNTKLFKIIGIILIACLFAWIGKTNAKTAHSAEPNAWNVIHELYRGDYGIDNFERNKLTSEYECILALVNYTDGRLANFSYDKYNLEARVKALKILIAETKYAYESVLKEIEIFVNTHKGI